TVYIIGDTIDEVDENFNIHFTSVTSTASAYAGPAAICTIIDDDDVMPSLAINNVTVTEKVGGMLSTATFTVSLTRPATSPVTFDFATADGTAVAGSDYQASSGTLTINAGEQTKNIGITIIGDDV